MMSVAGGREGCLRMTVIETASIPAEPRVLRDAASHVRDEPVSSVQAMDWNSIHFEFEEDRGEILSTRAEDWVGSVVDMVSRSLLPGDGVGELVRIICKICNGEFMVLGPLRKRK